MAEYIEREPIIEEMQSLIDNVSRNFPRATETELIILKGKYEAFMEYIKEQPAADVQPVKCGYWEEVTDYGGWGDTHYRCSVCGEEWYLEDGKPKDNNMNFCPRCGARMDGEQNV